MDYAGLTLGSLPKRCRPKVPDSPDVGEFNIEIMHTRTAVVLISRMG